MKKKVLNYKEQQARLKRNEKIKTGVYIGLLCLAIGGFTALTFVGAKSCKQNHKSENRVTIIGDYGVRSNKAVIDDLPYKYYYRYTNYEGLQDAQSTTVVYADTVVRLKRVDNLTPGENGTYITYKHFELTVFASADVVECYLFGSATGTDPQDYDTLYHTYYDNDTEETSVTSYIQLGFIDSSIDLMNYDGDNLCVSYLSNIIKSNAVVNLNQSFDFNSQINRYGVLRESNSFFSRQSFNGTNWVIRGYFKDELNNYYQGIKITYAQANGSGYYDPTQISSKQYNVYDQNGSQFIYLQYIRTDGSAVMVNTANYIQFDNKTAYTNTSRWLSDSFRHITIFYFEDMTTDLPLSDYSGLEILQMFNNDTINVGGGIGLDNGSVFNLLGQAFSSIASILNMQIIPGITLGLFIFIPFSIMILITCVWLFKR